MQLNIPKFFSWTKNIFSAAQLELGRFLLFIKNIKWLRVSAVFLVPLIISWPLDSGYLPFPGKRAIPIKNLEIKGGNKISNQSSELPQNFTAIGVGTSIGASTLLSSFLKIDTFPFPVFVVFENRLKIFDAEKEVDYAKLIDSEEAGAISIKLYNLDGSLKKDFYLKRNKKDNDIIQTGGAYLKNEFEFRNPIPFGLGYSSSEDGLLIKLEQKEYRVQFPGEIGFFHVQWNTKIFLINFLISLFAWWFVLKSSSEIIKFINLSKKKFIDI